MSEEFSYQNYVTDSKFMRGYSKYQEKYIKNARESDKVIINAIHKIVDLNENNGKTLSLLDVGCSTGNLLRHLKIAIPRLSLVGGDMVAKILKECRKDPELKGIRFREANVLDLGCEEKYDIITVNAVFYLLNYKEFEEALSSVSNALNDNGWLISFDFFHPFEQDLSIFEKSKSHPEGIALHFRPFEIVKQILKKSNFKKVDFNPFIIPISLNKEKFLQNDPDIFHELTTYTQQLQSGHQLLFRGTLAQPWCHLIAQK